jgi:hypothetical protein
MAGSLALPFSAGAPASLGCRRNNGSPGRVDLKVMAATSSTLDYKRLGLLLALLGVGVVGWHWPVLTPLKLVAVMGHETGHAAATWVMGGTVQRITVRPGESGECLSMIPSGLMARVAVSSAGYLGGCLGAVVLLVVTFRFGARRKLLLSLSLWLAGMGLLFGKDLFTVLFSLGMAGLFAAAARWLPESLVAGITLFIAAFQALYAVADVRDDLWNASVRAQSDAAILANTTGVPAIGWAVVWSAFSVAVLVLGGWAALRVRPKRLTT